MTVVGQDVEQQGSAKDIGAGVVANPVHRLACSRLRSQMNDRRDVVQGRNPILALADIATDDLYVLFLEQGSQLGLGNRAMDLRAQIVQQTHRHTAPDQLPGKCQPDKAEPSSDQDPFAHPLILTCLVSMLPGSIRLARR